MKRKAVRMFPMVGIRTAYSHGSCASASDSCSILFLCVQLFHIVEISLRLISL